MHAGIGGVDHPAAGGLQIAAADRHARQIDVGVRPDSGDHAFAGRIDDHHVREFETTRRREAAGIGRLQTAGVGYGVAARGPGISCLDRRPAPPGPTASMTPLFESERSAPMSPAPAMVFAFASVETLQSPAEPLRVPIILAVGVGAQLHDACARKCGVTPEICSQASAPPSSLIAPVLSSVPPKVKFVLAPSSRSRRRLRHRC